MNKLNFIAFPLSLTVLCVASGCYEAPTTSSSRTSSASTVTTTSATATPSTDKPAAPTTQNSPTKTGGNYQQAVSDYKAKNFEQAEAGFKEFLRSEPNHADANFYLGNIYYNQKKYDAALPHFEQAAKTDFKSVEKLMALGEAQRQLKQFDKSIVQFQKVIGFEPGNANAYYGLGLTYVGLNNSIAARQQLQKLEPLNKSLAERLAKEIDTLK